MASRRELAAWAASFGILATWLCWRAATQGLTHDEAETYRSFASHSWRYLFTHYSANHHVLHSILVKLSTLCFGVSELSLRIPAVLGGIAYAIGSVRLSTRLLGRSAWAVITATLLVLNPYVVDFLIASRGYALALAFFIWHIDSLFAGKTIRASILAGLAVSANLTFVVAIAATSTAHLIVEREQWMRRGIRLALPGAIVFGVICGLPLMCAADFTHFYAGVPALWQTAAGIAEVSFRHGERDYFVLALPAIAIAAGCALIALGKPVPRFFAITLILTIAQWILLRPFSIFYPTPRLALYGFVLVTLFLATGTAALHRRVLLVPLIAIAIAYAAQIQSTDFRDWRYDAATKRLFNIAQRSARPHARLCTDWEYEPTLSFYRALDPSPSFEPIERSQTDRCDFALINARESFEGVQHDRLFAKNHLREIARDPHSGSVLYAAY